MQEEWHLICIVSAVDQISRAKASSLLLTETAGINLHRHMISFKLEQIIRSNILLFASKHPGVWLAPSNMAAGINFHAHDVTRWIESRRAGGDSSEWLIWTFCCQEPAEKGSRAPTNLKHFSGFLGRTENPQETLGRSKSVNLSAKVFMRQKLVEVFQVTLNYANVAPHAVCLKTPTCFPTKSVIKYMVVSS